MNSVAIGHIYPHWRYIIHTI